MYSVRLFLLPAVLLPVAAQSPLICEDSINNHAPFDFNDVPCLLGCGMQISRPTGSLLPGSVNETDIPYCRLNCVHKNVTPAQLSAAPSCNSKCENGNGATPDQLGWCMYWCVTGEQFVVSTTCIPELQYTPVSTSTLATYSNAPDEVVTIDGFTQLPAWSSWYQTQTVLPRSCNMMFGAPSSCSMQGSQAQETSSSMSLSTSQTTFESPAVTPPAKTSSQAVAEQNSFSAQTTTAPSLTGDAEAQSSRRTAMAMPSTSTSAATTVFSSSMSGFFWIFAGIWTVPAYFSL